MSLYIWKYFLTILKNKLSPIEFSMWIRPLKAQLINNNIFELYAPNQFVLDWIKKKYLHDFNQLLYSYFGPNHPLLKIKIIQEILNKEKEKSIKIKKKNNFMINQIHINQSQLNLSYCSNINKNYNFDNFVEGKSNHLARSITYQIANNIGKKYNPLFLYSKTGLGKTHLLNAVTNNVILNKKNAKIIYINSKLFIKNIIYALKYKIIDRLKNYYKSVDFFLIDDVQYFSDKEKCKEEFFHTFYTLLQGNQQIILTANCYPKEIKGIEDFLKLKFNFDLVIAINPPELNTRMSILIHKAYEKNILLSKDVAYFIAKKLHSNVRDLEIIINTIIIKSIFNHKKITINFVQKILYNLFNKTQIVTIDIIQKMVSKYYQIKLTDLLSKKRLRSIVLSRQIAMAITKKLTNYSLSEIGNAFGGRDHTTVLHACRTIEQLIQKNHNINNDFFNLIKTLSI
ncbi:Chromosomal replication initiator protein DnaA [Buchnera aphidicola (Eriosoma grossulariae)]